MGNNTGGVSHVIPREVLIIGDKELITVPLTASIHYQFNKYQIINKYNLISGLKKKTVDVEVGFIIKRNVSD